MTTPLYHVDAFTNEPFSGNPAVVCPLDGPTDAAWMQHVAAEMNVSETAFLYSVGKDFNLRWFTPTTEVDLCGHATLASAHVLWEQGLLAAGTPARFHTASGLLTVTSADGWLHLDLPAVVADAIDSPPGLEEALGAKTAWVGETRLDYIAEFASESVVRELDPGLAAIAKLPVRAVIVTAKADSPRSDAVSPRFDYVCRVFGPGHGIPEDPVTGSAQCALGPYWQAKLGKDDLAVYQASRRGGFLRVRPKGDRVIVSGQAVTTTVGEFSSAAQPL
jgi:PhzF family phenazine biosynthesis protein